MARVCDLTGKKRMIGNNVSHSHRKTRRKFVPNIQNATFISKFLGKISLSVTARAIKTIDFKGGIDRYLTKTPARKLTDQAAKLKNKIAKLAQN